MTVCTIIYKNLSYYQNINTVLAQNLTVYAIGSIYSNPLSNTDNGLEYILAPYFLTCQIHLIPLIITFYLINFIITSVLEEFPYNYFVATCLMEINSQKYIACNPA